MVGFFGSGSSDGEGKGKKLGDAVRAGLVPPRCRCAWGASCRPRRRRRAPNPRCAQVKYYAFIEICLWLPSTWLICYRFQPAIRFYSTATGREVVRRGATFLERWAPSTHAKLAKLAGNIYGSPSGRTTAEWLLINKVVSPVTFPIKMWLGHLVAQRQRLALPEPAPAPVTQAQ